MGGFRKGAVKGRAFILTRKPMQIMRLAMGTFPTEKGPKGLRWNFSFHREKINRKTFLLLKDVD